MKATVLVPPLNFAMVSPGIYRSGYPNKKNYRFLNKLKLKSILYLCEDDYDPNNLKFIEEQEISSFHLRVVGNKEPFVEIDHALIASALSLVMNSENHPILVHCNKGKYRVGCLVGCLRKIQQWTLASIFDEYRRFISSTLRIADQEVIRLLIKVYRVVWFGRKKLGFTDAVMMI